MGWIGMHGLMANTCIDFSLLEMSCHETFLGRRGAFCYVDGWTRMISPGALVD